MNLEPSPAGCSEYLDKVDAARRILHDAYAALTVAWDRELKRKYAYDWLHVPAGEIGDLEIAQNTWIRERSKFQAFLGSGCQR